MNSEIQQAEDRSGRRHAPADGRPPTSVFGVRRPRSPAVCWRRWRGCGQRQGGSSGRTPGGSVVIRVEGSDTMVNLAQAWAEEYSKSHPEVSVQVSGGGSGVGIASLIDGRSRIWPTPAGR